MSECKIFAKICWRSQYFITQIQYSGYWSIHCNYCSSLKLSQKVWYCESAGIYVFGGNTWNQSERLPIAIVLILFFWQQILENYSILWWLFENWLGLKGKVFILFILLTSTATKLNETLSLYSDVCKIISRISFTSKEHAKLNILSAHQ